MGSRTVSVKSRAGQRAQPGSMLEATPAEACEAYAKALEENWDERLYLNFRRKVDELSSHLKHAAQGGREDEKLWAATSGTAADATGEMLPGTVDLDLQFLGPRGLRVLVVADRPQVVRILAQKCSV